MMQHNLEDIRLHLKLCFLFLNEFKHLTESYIIEYFTSKHWEKIPTSWRDVLDGLEPTDIAEQLLTCEKPEYKNVWPLSLLAFKQTAHTLSLPRQPTNMNDKLHENTSQNKLLKHIFRKHINPKKQHEICILSELIARIYSEAKCNSVIDVGCGQGHLSRLLSLGYDLPVIGVEREMKFLEMAQKFDEEALLHIAKKEKEVKKLPQQTPCHVQYTVPPDVKVCDFINDMNKTSSKDSHLGDKRYLLSGLHACGDLSPIMIRLFKESSQVQALVSVACCYMKLTTDFYEPDKCGGNQPQTATQVVTCYPMSDYVKTCKSHKLPYKSREVACHAIEDYKERLKDNGAHLKMHCYRAVLEYLIRKMKPDLQRPGVQTIKKAYLLPFSEYTEKAFKKLNLSLPHTDDENIPAMLAKYNHVVAFFTLALMIAPVVESVILLDRLLYLMENDLQCELLSIFDPVLSPRCFAIIATKKPDEMT